MTNTASNTSQAGDHLPPPNSAGLLGIAQQLLDDLRAALQARAHLLVLEAQRAGMALTLMALYAVLAALLGLTAWLSLWALLITLAVQAGIPIALALLGAIVVSAAVGYLLVRLARAEAKHLLFPATVRHLGRRSNNSRAEQPGQANAAQRPA